MSYRVIRRARGKILGVIAGVFVLFFSTDKTVVKLMAFIKCLL